MCVNFSRITLKFKSVKEKLHFGGKKKKKDLKFSHTYFLRIRVFVLVLHADLYADFTV